MYRFSSDLDWTKGQRSFSWLSRGVLPPNTLFHTWHRCSTPALGRTQLEQCPRRLAGYLEYPYIFNGAQTIRPKTILPIWNSDNSAKSIQTIQSVLQNARFERKKSELEILLGLRSPVGALCARLSFAAITCSNFRIESYPLLASSQHVGATAAVTIIGWIFCILLAEFQIGWIVFGRIVWTRFSTNNWKAVNEL